MQAVVHAFGRRDIAPDVTLSDGLRDEHVADLAVGPRNASPAVQEGDEFGVVVVPGEC